MRDKGKTKDIVTMSNIKYIIKNYVIKFIVNTLIKIVKSLFIYFLIFL